MAKGAIYAPFTISERFFFEAFSPLDLFFVPAPFHPAPRPFPASLHPGCLHLPASAHPVSSSIPTYSISRPSAQVNIIPAWFPSLSETSARAVFIFRASVALDFCRSSGPPAVTSSPVFATARCRCRATTPSASPQAIMSAPAPVPAAAPALAPSCARRPRSWREAMQGPLRSVRVTDPPCQPPSVIPPMARTPSGGGALDRA